VRGAAVEVAVDHAYQLDALHPAEDADVVAAHVPSADDGGTQFVHAAPPEACSATARASGSAGVYCYTISRVT
jgi:hypothetical protein